MSIAILTPKAMGLADNRMYLPVLVQREFVSNFSSYSAISVLDRERLDEQYGELLSGYYDDNAKVGQDLGHLPPTSHIMGGTITKTATGYALQIAITRTADKMTVASYSGTCTFAELDNLSGILTVARTGNLREDALSEIAAYKIEVENRRIDDKNRMVWLKQLADCENYFAGFFRTANAPLELVYSTDIQRVSLDKKNETITVQFSAMLHPMEKSWFSAARQTIAAVRNGLIETGRAEAWGLADWPAKSVATPFANIRRDYAITAELLDEHGASLSKAAFTLTGGWDCTISAKKSAIFKAFSGSGSKDIVFAPIKVLDMTDTVSIKISSINNIDAETAAQNGMLAITGDTQRFIQAGAMAVASTHREIRQKKWEEYKANYAIIPPLYFEIGYV